MGASTSVRKRGVPSAGGCYPLQWHLLCGEGFDLPAGIYSCDPETGEFCARARPTSTAILPPERARVVIAALPRRTAARYHHRSALVIIGDVAYALALLRAGCTGLGVDARQLVARANQVAASALLPAPCQWQSIWAGSETEIPMVGVEISLPETRADSADAGKPYTAPGSTHPSQNGHGVCIPTGQLPTLIAGRAAALKKQHPTPSLVPGAHQLGVNVACGLPEIPVVPLSITQIQARRCPTPEELTAGASTHSRGFQATHGPLSDWCSHQRWVDQAPNLHLYRADDTPREQWLAHYQAACDMVNLLARGINCRPVSGWVHGGPYGNISHALVEEVVR